MSVLRAPALHFLLLGGALWALGPWTAPSRQRIVLTTADVMRLRAAWSEAHGAAPGRLAETALLRTAADEEMLYREALGLGLDRQDAAVRERLVRLGGFVSEDALRGRDALESEARRLGLERHDVVIRRHLVQMMDLAAGRLGAADLPTEAELQAYLVAHADAFTQPARIRLTQVYLGRAQHGGRLAADAVRLLDDLRATHVPPPTAAQQGDPFIRGPDIGPATRLDLERVFGSQFVDAIENAPLAEWIGPIASSYGLHLAWLHERVPAELPPLATVQNQVLHRLVRERSAARRQARIEALRVRYDVATEAVVP